MLSLLLGLGIFGLVTSTVFAGMVVAGLRHHIRMAELEPAEWPAMTLLKPLHGDEPGLAEHLAKFFEQDYPEFEILFCDFKIFQRLGCVAGRLDFTLDGLEKIGGLIAHRVQPRERGNRQLRRDAIAGVFEDFNPARAVIRQRCGQFEFDPAFLEANQG